MSISDSLSPTSPAQKHQATAAHPWQAGASQPAGAAAAAVDAQREKDAMLAAARKKLQKYRKSKKAKRTSTSGSISSLRSTTTTSSSSSSLNQTLNGTATPAAGSTSAPRQSHQRKRSSFSGGAGGSKGSLSAFRMPLATAAPSFPVAGPTSAWAGHARDLSSAAGGGGGGEGRHRHGHKRSISTKLTFPPPPPAAALGGRKPRPASMGYYPPSASSSSSSSTAPLNNKPFAFPSSAPAAGTSTAQPAAGAAAASRRHSHRRSLSVSTKHGSLSLLLPPDVAAKLAASPASTTHTPFVGGGGGAAAAAEERRRTLAALESGRSRQPSTGGGGGGGGRGSDQRPLSGLGVSGWDTTMGGQMDPARLTVAGGRTADLSLGRVVLPDFGGLREDESFDHGPSFGFPSSPTAARAGFSSSSTAAAAKRESLTFSLAPSATADVAVGGGYLSLPPPSLSYSASSTSSPALSSPAFPSSPTLPLSSSAAAVSLAIPPTAQQVGGSPIVVSSPRFGPDGFPLALGGIAEESESSSSDTDEAAAAADADDDGGGLAKGDKGVRRASQQVSLPPARFGRFLGSHSPRLSGGGWAAAAAANKAGPATFPSSPLAGAAFATTTAKGEDERSTAAARGPSSSSSPVFDGPKPSFDLSDSPPPTVAAQPADEGSRLRTFAFPKGPVAPSPFPPPPPPAVAEGESATAEREPVEEEADGDKTPNPPASATLEPAAPLPAAPAPTAKKALRPLTLGSLSSPAQAGGPNGSSTTVPSGGGGGPRNLRPLSLSLASSTGSSGPSSTPSRPASSTAFGSGSSFGFVSPPPPPPSSTHGRYGPSSLGYGRPRGLSGSRGSNLSLSSSTSSTASSAGAALNAGGGGGGRSSSLSWTPSPGGVGTPLSVEKRRSSISYGKSPTPSPATTAQPGVGGAGKRSVAKCPTRPLSLASAASSSRRVLTDVGEGGEDDGEEADADADADDDDDDHRSITSPFAHDDDEADPFVHRSPTEPSPVASAEEQRLRHLLEGVESERDALAEDVDGWRQRCRALEDKLAEEKRIAVVERDLARERIRKLGDRLASLTPDENTSAAHLTAQTRLVTEMRDQIFSLASSLARSEELRTQAEEALREEVDIRERRIAEAVDEDRRARPTVGARVVVAPANAPETPPLLSGSNSSSVSSNVSTNRSSYGLAVAQQQAPAVRLAAADDDHHSPAGGYDSWKASPWGAGGTVLQPTGELEPDHPFGIVPSPRALESLTEEDAEEEPLNDDDDDDYNRSFSSSAYDVSDDNAALGLGSSGEFDPDGYDEDLPHNFLSPRPDEHDDDGGSDPTTPVQPDHLPADLTAQYGATPRAVSNGDGYAPSAPVLLQPPQQQQQQQQEPPRHAKRHSLQRTWVMPRGPVGVSPEPPQVEIVAPVVLTTDDDEDVKPFGTWVVPPSPFFNSAADDDDDSGRFASNSFPSAVHAPPAGAASVSTGGYNDPPASLFPHDLRLAPSGGPNRPNAGSRSVSAPLPNGRGTAPPPISRSAVYHAAHPSVGSTATGMSESSSLFSLSSLTTTIGSYVLPPKGGGPAGVLCSIIPEDEDGQSVGQSSGQWVVRAHDSSPLSSSSPGHVGRPSTSNGATTLARSSSSASFRPPQSSASRRASKAYVDPRNQPPPYASPVGLLDFRQTCCGDDWSGVIEL